MTKIVKLNQMETPENFISNIRDKEIIVYEDVQGSKIYVNFDGFNIHIKPKSIHNPDINIIDMTTQYFYNKAYIFFHSLSDVVLSLIPKTYVFCFEYFPDEKPANIQYDKTPKNNLILTCIYKKGKYVYDYDELVEYSKLLDVDVLPVLYKGVLSENQLNSINKFIRLSDNDRLHLFGEDSFAKYFYNLLNVNTNNSFLMKDKFNENIEKIILKINGDCEYSFEFLNPIFKRNSEVNDEYIENYSMILIDFMQFLGVVDLKSYKTIGLTKNDIYIDLICRIFNDYMKNQKRSILAWNIPVPEFYHDEKYKLNLSLIKNDITLDNIKNNPILEYILRIVVDNFRIEKKKPIGLFSEQTLVLFNKYVEEIRNTINLKLNLNISTDVLNQKTKTLDEFIQMNKDLEGKMYPQIQDEIESDGEDKKGKKSVKKIKK